MRAPTPDGSCLAGKAGPPTVHDCPDQHGRVWLRVAYRGHVAHAPLDLLFADEGAFYDALLRGGVRVLDPKVRSLVRQTAEGPPAGGPIHVVEAAGFHGGCYFATGELLPGTLHGVPVVDARPDGEAGAGTAGSPADWRSGAHRLANGQALPTFVLAYGFAAILLALVGRLIDNPGAELVGPSSIGKSYLLRLLATIFGDPARLLACWDATINGLEGPMARADGGALLLDEGSQFLADGGADRRHAMARAMFKLAHGTEKARYGTTSVRRRFAFLSSTNVPLSALTAGLSVDEAAGVRVRVLSIPSDAGTGLGVFDRLPPGCATGAEAIAALHAFVGAQHGHAAPAFARRLAACLSAPSRHAWLEDYLARRMRAFARRAGLDRAPPTVARAGQTFALAYAAGCLARRWRLLPLDRMGPLILEVHRRTVAAEVDAVPVAGGAPAVIGRYVERHAGALHDLREGYPNLSATACDAAPGFLQVIDGALHLLLRPARWTAAFGSRGPTLLRDLRQSGHLVARDGLQFQTRVRRLVAKDRVYAIRLDTS